MLLLLLVLHASAGLANLVRIGPESVVTLGSEDLAVQIAHRVNAASGDHALCHAVDMGTFDRVYCQLYDVNNSALTGISTTNFAGERVQAIDLDVADNGNFFMVVMTTQSGGSRRARMSGWTRNGSVLFAAVEILPALNWFDVSIAATPSGPWVGGSGVLGVGQDVQARVYTYNNTGANTGMPLLVDYPGTNLNLCAFRGNSDLAVNSAGDVAFTWIKPSFYSACQGTILTRTLRASGTISPERQLSAIVRDGMGHDASPNRAPKVVSVDADRFVHAWSTGSNLVSATIDHTAVIVSPETVVLPGDLFELAGDPATGDYVLATRETQQNGGCLTRTQLVIEGQLIPITRFDLGSCFGVEQFHLQFQRNGQLVMARSYFDRATLTRIDLPAQIEVNNVTVSEGDPGPGAPPSAAINVTLTKPQPNGENVQVSYYTRNGTALAGQDYALAQDTVVFDGTTAQTAATVLLSLLPDHTYEDDERFTVEFEQPVNAVIRNGEERANIVIDDDDNTPPITPDCANNDPLQCRTIPEPDSGQSTEFQIHLNLAEPVAANLQIQYQTGDGTALAGTDYVARSGSVQIVAGATDATIVLTVLGDETPEDTETFHLRLNAPNAVQLSATDLIVHILDDAICYLEVAPNSLVSESAGSTETLNVTTRPNCNWTVSATEPWITITTPVSNVGNGVVNVDIAPFAAPVGVFDRSGAVQISLATPAITKTIPVDQDGDCQFTVDTGSLNIGVEGGTSTVQVDASVPECPWIVSSPVPWITILSPLEPVFGDGQVRLSVDANAAQANQAAGTRNVTLDSDEVSISVAQAGCTYALDQTSVSASASGDASYTVNLDTPGVCRWTAVSRASWILVQNGASGTGDGAIEIFVLDNPTVQPRTGTVSIGDQTLAVTQAGLACNYTLDPASIAACPDGRAFSLDVTATDGCLWTLHSGAAWIEVLDGLAGEGSDQSTGVIDLNLSETERSSNLALRAQNIDVASTSVRQEGYLTYETFEGARPADWDYAPDSVWAMVPGSLFGHALDVAGIATALDQDGVCRECEIEATVTLTSLGSSPSDALTLLGWYRDSANQVGVSMNEFSNRWTLYQLVGGTRVSVTADVSKILPNHPYALRLSFDGNVFRADVDGAPLLQLPVQGAPPTGRGGLSLNNSNARLSEFRVTRLAAMPVSNGDLVFSGGFEAAETPNLSQCLRTD
ncbi:hypothetical protein C7S18_18855 [Ahniella affigens]|uniref:Calx-beta domain-containing protein n=1 Tax=Ahniella affigens TaxID=2021234 RepID=A0A2P1PW67_9GAMM|nr:hypothetical protein C7S18_18855 [Ahniella affigens]